MWYKGIKLSWNFLFWIWMWCKWSYKMRYFWLFSFFWIFLLSFFFLWLVCLSFLWSVCSLVLVLDLFVCVCFLVVLWVFCFFDNCFFNFLVFNLILDLICIKLWYLFYVLFKDIKGDFNFFEFEDYFYVNVRGLKVIIWFLINRMNL